MNATRDPETILAAWLDEGPIDLPDATRRAILTALPTSSQARRGPFAPRRFHPMATHRGLAAAVVAIVAIGVALLLIGPRLGVGPASSPSPTPRPTGPVSAGRVTLTDTGCTWESNPGTMARPDVFEIHLVNETEHYADFQLHWVRDGHTYAEGEAFVAELARRLKTGEEWQANDVSLAIAAHGVDARSDTTVRWPTKGVGEPPAPGINDGSSWAWPAGAYGIVCSANTSPTGDILTTFLVGPLQLDRLLIGLGAFAPTVDTAAWVPLQATRHGYELRHPSTGRVRQATMPLTFDLLRSNSGKPFLGGDFRFVGGFDEYFDTITPAAGTLYPIFGAASTRIPDGMAEDEWLAVYRQADNLLPRGPCVPPRDQWQSVTIGGVPSGAYMGCAVVEAISFVGGRAYTFSVTSGMGGAGSDEAELLRAYLSTVRFHPELASDSP
jgi:hypothetical protein